MVQPTPSESAWVLALDQGTSSTRAILFDSTGQPRVTAQQEFDQIFPADGWVEHDPEHIWSTALAVCQQVLAQVPTGITVVSMGITNQRETIVLWDRTTGAPLHNALVWQDRRTADRCAELSAEGREEWLVERTGLLIDPYFSATKLAWLLDHVPGARARAARGELAAGTIDSFLIWRLTRGAHHITDATNASRTQLYSLALGDWDPELLDCFNVPPEVLPVVVDSAGDLATVDAGWFGMALPVCGIAGDQQAALVGQACLQPGMTKSTYGTGCFLMSNVGTTVARSEHRLLSTVAFQIGGVRQYALEGGIFAAGVALKWLRDTVGLIDDVAETERFARAADGDAHGVYVVPAFVGLGAPWWDAQARGLICGLTLDSTPQDIALATLQAVAFQTDDLMQAARSDGAGAQVLRVDGGMVVNDWLCQFIADMLEMPVERPVVTETTALGAAMLAAVGCELVPDLAALAQWWQRDQRFEPNMDATRRAGYRAGWLEAVARSRGQPG